MHDGYFGAAGDLTKRLLLPALYNLARTELLPANFALIGVDRLEMSDDAYRQHLDAAVRAFAADKHYSQTLDEAHWGELLKRISYLPGDFSDPQAYGHLKHKLAELRQSQVESDSVLFYLAVGARFWRYRRPPRPGRLAGRGRGCMAPGGGGEAFWQRCGVGSGAECAIAAQPV